MSSTGAYALPKLRERTVQMAVFIVSCLAMVATLVAISPGTSDATWNPWPGPIGGPCEVDLFDFPQGSTYMTSLGLGEYNLDGSLNWLNNDIESVYVPDGLVITVSAGFDDTGWWVQHVGPGVFEVQDDVVSWILVEGNCGKKKKGGELGDFVWFDINGDGIQDAGEPGIDGVTVVLRQGGVAIDTAITDSTGFYLFEDLDEGTYAAQVRLSTVPFGLTQTYDASGALDNRSVTFIPAGGVNLDQDFGYELLLGELGDTVWLDDNGDGIQDAGEAGIPGVTVFLRQNGVVIDTAITDDDGMYVFSDLVRGRYAVQVDRSSLPVGVAQTYDLDGVLNNRSAYTLAPGEINLDLDFGYQPQIGNLGDTVWLDANGDGVQDAGEAGIPGVTMLLRQGGVVVDTAVTDVDGMYLFTDLLEGNWAVQVQASTLPDGLAQTYDADGGLDNRSVTFVPGGGEDLDQDFGYRALLGDLGDTVWLDADSDRTQNNGEVGIPDVTVLLRQGGVVIDSTMTDADGMYLFADLVEGTYAVEIDTTTLPADLIQTHDDSGALDHRSSTFVPGGGQDLDQDFGYVEPAPLGSIGDFVFYDRNSNGEFDQQAGVEDQPLENVTVNLLDDAGAIIATDVTDVDGLYLFPDLPLNLNYTVAVDTTTVTPPPGAGLDRRQTFDLDGTLDSTSTTLLGDGGLNDDLRHDFGYAFDED